MANNSNERMPAIKFFAAIGENIYKDKRTQKQTMRGFIKMLLNIITKTSFHIICNNKQSNGKQQ